jgi:hypothetical protein
VLLTGAGFTQSFGGFLSGEMWAEIFNQPEVRGSQQVRQAMLNEMNYEVVYSRILDEHSPDDRRAILTATRNAYLHMHRIMCKRPGQTGLPFAACSQFLRRFGQTGRAYIFTLNQDLFVETFFDPTSGLRIPGLTHPRWFTHSVDPELTPSHAVRLPDAEAVEQLRKEPAAGSSFSYVKLHGSLMWQTKDGSDVMVIGTTKSRIIASEPLLRWNLELFKEVLGVPSRRLAVIGYGFGDSHINEIIAGAVQGNDLKLFVVSPEEPSSFRHHLLRSPDGDTLWKGLSGYYCGTVIDLYDPVAVQLPERGIRFFRDIGIG